MKFTVTVLHNWGSGRFLAYQPGDLLAHAHEFDVTADGLQQAAELVWVLTNVDGVDFLRLHHPHLSAYAELVRAYRERGNRSLSMGDVLIVDEHLPAGRRRAGVLTPVSVGYDMLDVVPTYRPGLNDTPRSASYDHAAQLN